ncbi:MAG: TolC family protein [Phycisphaeraceae bacterium]|nr:TolC family protein [Phycisphaeraceae bacterium]
MPRLCTPSTLLSVFLAVGVITLGGCSRGLSDIDRVTNRLMAARTDTIGAGPTAPIRESQDPNSVRRPYQNSIDPDTTNPDVSELTFVPADEARDVASRLESYARRASGVGQEVRTLTITDVFRIVQRSGREYLNAEEDYLLTAISLLIEQHRWGPRLFNDTSVSIGAAGDSGSFDHALNVVNSLRATQRLPYGGEVEARWVWRATEQLRSSVSGQYRQSSELILGGSIPLLRGGGVTARESIIQAERDMIYAARSFEDFRRSFLADIADDYFALLQTRSQIANQERQIESLRRLNEATQARVDAGRESRFRVAIVENQLLSGVASLASLREQYILQLDRFKVRLGLDPKEPIEIAALEFELAEPEIDEYVAAQHALEYRLDLQNQRDRVTDARRAVANAKNNVLPDLDISGQVGVPTDPGTREGGVDFDFDYTRYSAGVDLSLPLDRKIEQLGLKRTMVQLERQIRNYERARDDVVVTSRSAVRQIDRARFSLTLAERQVAINRERLREQKLKEDIVDPQSIVDSENDLLRSENDRDRAKTDLRNAILNYLVVTGQMRVAPGGEFQPVPGMMLDTPAGAVPIPLPDEIRPTPGAEGPKPAELPGGGEPAGEQPGATDPEN